MNQLRSLVSTACLIYKLNPFNLNLIAINVIEIPDRASLVRPALRRWACPLLDSAI